MTAGKPARGRFRDVYERVREELLSGRYRPDQRIVIDTLSARVNASATPVREVLARLVGEGLLAEEQGRGHFIPPLDQKDLSDLYALVELCLARAIREADSGMPAYTPELDVASALLSTEPHGAITRLFDLLLTRSGNRALAASGRQLLHRLQRVRRCEASLLGDGEAEGRRLVDAAIAGDRSVAREALRAYFRRRARAAGALARCLSRHDAII